ncbi:fibronectin type 3 and ankyrin repeat domains protein 1 isoform X1 [Hemiscyllium ocellatum]|uniref:fibronectin type 3 and ankyrin repeat domains protein 1 isoform X1 n=1 Tax=Hemiscyllium ocellatum TaxID=170820 RepID=UPI002966617B|nr:fibronectin type 3 and ankyrin repeat domains protein 1 isoform X1 [Hemiscyllium ocellatum]XP_060697974.1 fibronectin type 3 and ankyrin repeat domains protein 1 isoform X1 [Hemiscyllium ocellatum]XP_060697975.1 fibronectin type 3 and ankyrin repeat domains protein 1 isoform X1 [Hemiscyllium ocellatum]XP_060697977.1 fibronectin type 3 and ankyrin repeat domains protein 1 isoform X1 [Hemiscyllium ocellatum]XP_060697978.1 fibronectin type 3 and ankyrin repeat domains protein 1 isoform X1 [Hemi
MEDVPKPDPPVVGKVTDHSIELYWNKHHQLQGYIASNRGLCFSIEEEDIKTHTFGNIYTGYAKHHVVTGLEASTPYRFRLKVISSTGNCAYSPIVTVSTTREPKYGKHLHCAVIKNDIEEVCHILQSGNMKVDVLDEGGFSPLMLAAQKGYQRIVEILIKSGADVNQKNGSGKDSLMLACFAGHLDVAKCLRRFGATWESQDNGGSSAIHWATDGGHLNMIEWMINEGCKVDITDGHLLWTPLMRVAVLNGSTEVASLLIKAGANVNIQDKKGTTPLMVAVLNSYENLVQLLLNNGADSAVKNKYGTSVLEMAKSFSTENVISLLEEYGRREFTR